MGNKQSAKKQKEIVFRMEGNDGTDKWKCTECGYADNINAFDVNCFQCSTARDTKIPQVIHKLDETLEQYYKKMGRNDYLNSKGIGKFVIFCQKYHFDDDTIKQDLSQSSWNLSILADFDDNFPLYIECKTENEKLKAVFQTLQHCYTYNQPPNQSDLPQSPNDTKEASPSPPSSKQPQNQSDFPQPPNDSKEASPSPSSSKDIDKSEHKKGGIQEKDTNILPILDTYQLDNVQRTVGNNDKDIDTNIVSDYTFSDRVYHQSRIYGCIFWFTLFGGLCFFGLGCGSLTAGVRYLEEYHIAQTATTKEQCILFQYKAIKCTYTTGGSKHTHWHTGWRYSYNGRATEKCGNETLHSWTGVSSRICPQTLEPMNTPITCYVMDCSDATFMVHSPARSITSGLMLIIVTAGIWALAIYIWWRACCKNKYM